MASLKDCIDASIRQGQITLEEGQALKKRYDNIAKRVLSTGKAKEDLLAEIEAEAAERQRRAMLTETVRKSVTDGIDSHRAPNGQSDPVMAFLFKHEHFGEAKFDDAEAKRAAILAGAHTQLDALLHEFRRGALVGDKKRTSKLVGNRKTQARMDNVVAELFGENSKDVNAKALAENFAKVADDLRVRFNEAGGAIGKLEKWGLPQFHNQEALLNYGQARWVEYMIRDGVLNRERMVHPLTGKVMPDAELREALEVSWKRITTDGWIDREPSGAAQGKGALFKQHADHRFLHFKNADAWLKYARDFGDPDPFHSMMAHLSSMSRDISHMETWGPNPEAGRTYQKQRILQSASTLRPIESMIAESTARLNVIRDKFAANQQKLFDRLSEIPVQLRMIREKRPGFVSRRGKIQLNELHDEFKGILSDLNGVTRTYTDPALEMEFRSALDALENISQVPFAKVWDPVSYAGRIFARADEMWAAQRGTLNTPVDSRIANAMNVLRNWVTASTLGSAQLAAFSDVAFGSSRRGFAGMARAKSNVVTVLKDTIKYIGTDNKREAVRSGLILDSALHVMQQQARYTGSMDTRTISGFLADRTIALQGLAAWTQAGKHAFGMSLQAMFADHVNVPWKDLPPLVRDTLERHGFSERGNGVTWNMIRKAALYEPKDGATFLRPSEIAAAAGRDAAEKYTAMILRETRYAVPEATVRSRTWMVNGRPGTVVGELSRSFAQFKSFGAAVIMLHGGQVARLMGAGEGARAAKYAGALLLTGALVSLVVLAMKDIASGRDPRRWTDDETYLDPDVWGAAVLQSGGLGIYGDFLFSNLNRHGGGISSTVAGPLWGRVNNVLELTLGNAQNAIQGRPTNFNADALKFVRQNTPVVSSHWAMKTAYNRVLLDQIQKLIDAKAQASFQRQKTTARRQKGQEFWWEPGEQSPHRAPDLGAMFRKQR